MPIFGCFQSDTGPSGSRDIHTRPWQAERERKMSNMPPHMGIWHTCRPSSHKNLSKAHLDPFRNELEANRHEKQSVS